MLSSVASFTSDFSIQWKEWVGEKIVSFTGEQTRWLHKLISFSDTLLHNMQKCIMILSQRLHPFAGFLSLHSQKRWLFFLRGINRFLEALIEYAWLRMFRFGESSALLENWDLSIENRVLILDSILDPGFSRGSSIECPLTFEWYCKCDHSNKSYWAVLSCGAVYFAVQSGSNFWVCGWNPKVWPFKWKLLSNTF